MSRSEKIWTVLTVVLAVWTVIRVAAFDGEVAFGVAGMFVAMYLMGGCHTLEGFPDGPVKRVRRD